MVERYSRWWPLAALVPFGALGCGTAPTAVEAPSFVVAVVITGMRGSGAIGLGEPTAAGGVNRQVFDADVGTRSGMAYGTLDYTDYGFTKADGNPPHLVVGPTWAGTAIVTFVQTSGTCVEFEGVGRLLNTGELLGFRAQTCDNGQPGVGLDVFAIAVPQRLITDATLYQRGPDMLSSGELTLSGSVLSTPGLAP